MWLRRSFLAPIALGSVVSCGGEPAAKPVTKKPPASCEAPNRQVGDRCVEPGVQDDGCPAGTVGLDDGTCRAAGVPPELCAEGFTPNTDGCDPILPTMPCAAGLLAVPGDTACHEVMPCGGDPTWGDAPVDAATQFVDGAYPGGDSDGTEGKPWTSIGAASAAAPDGGLVAIAAGSYAEALTIHKRVRIWGRCPATVEMVGPADDSALAFLPGSDGSELHGVAFRGGFVPLVVTGAKDVVLDRIWAHGTSFTPIQVHNASGPARATLTDSLIEDGRAAGVFTTGGELVVERSVIRGTRARPDYPFAAGVLAQENSGPSAPSSLTLRRTVVDDNDDIGVLVTGSSGTIEASVVRGTRPSAAKRHGRGIQVQFGVEQPGNLDAKSTVVTDNLDAGVYVLGATATLEGITVRRTTPPPAGLAGTGIAVWDTHPDGRPSSATVRASLVEDSRKVGLLVSGSTAVLEGVLVRRTQPEQTSQSWGIGIHVQSDLETSVRTAATLRGVTSDGNLVAGVMFLDADATVEGTLVTATATDASEGSFGDGLMIVLNGPAQLDVSSSVLRANARAGISLFGGAATLSTSLLECNPIDIDLEAVSGVMGALADQGSNMCTCDASEPCKALTSGLAPPGPIASEP